MVCVFELVRGVGSYTSKMNFWTLYRPHKPTMTKQPFVANTQRKEGFTHVLLITTGSVASVKAPLIVSELLSVGISFNPDIPH